METKIKSIIDKILQKWKAGKIVWKQIDNHQLKFETSLKERKIIFLKAATNQYYFSLIDSEGKTIFNQRVHQRGHSDEEKLFPMASEMHRLILRQISGIDEKLDDILGDLEEI